jgi:hypothetical protein
MKHDGRYGTPKARVQLDHLREVEFVALGWGHLRAGALKQLNCLRQPLQCGLLFIIAVLMAQLTSTVFVVHECTRPPNFVAFSGGARPRPLQHLYGWTVPGTVL